jgi:uncharacterized Tic20 family protein
MTISDSDARLWAVASHAAPLLGFQVLGPLVIWLVLREDARVEPHAREALNFGITLLLAFALGFVASVVTCGLGAFVVVPLLALLGIAALVFHVLAIVAAADGRVWRYPGCIRLVK